MKRRLLSVCLILALTLSLLPGLRADAGALEPSEYPQWAEMGAEPLAVRVTVDGTTSSRVEVGEVFRVEFWINGIDPYSLILPVAWDPAVVTLYNETAQRPAVSGRKAERDSGDGFITGAACYDSSSNEAWKAYYWNGKPVFSGSKTEEGYPYIDNEHGYATFLYYVNAPTASQQPQLFLTLTFQAKKAGDPGLHIATSKDSYYDKASASGLTLAYTGAGVTTENLEIPSIRVISQAGEESTVPLNPGETTPGYDPGNAPSHSSSSQSGGAYKPGGASEENWSTPEENYAGNGTPADSNTPATLRPAAHLTYPYSQPLYSQAVVASAQGKQTLTSDNYVIPAGTMAQAVSDAISQGSKAVVIKTPDSVIDKSEYALTIPCDNLDDLAQQSGAVVYAETPWGFAGFLPGGVLQDCPGASSLTLRLSPLGDGAALTVEVDGKAKEGFSGPYLYLILPSREQNVAVKSDTVFGQAREGKGDHPIPLTHYDPDSKTVLFASPSAGRFILGTAQTADFTDVTRDHWAYDAISALFGVGVVTGVSAHRYDPSSAVTRGQVATLVTRGLGTYQAGAGCTFRDVTDSQYYYPFVASANTLGIVTGYSPDRFGPGDKVTRQDLAVILYRGMKLMGLDMTPVREAPVFTDADQIAGYARDAVTALYRMGIISGYPDGSFGPRGTTNRAAAAQMIYGVYRQVSQLL